MSDNKEKKPNIVYKEGVNYADEGDKLERDKETKEVAKESKNVTKKRV